MGASVRPDPVSDYLAAKGQGTSDPVSDYLAAKSAVAPRGASGSFADEPNPGVGAHLLQMFSGIPGVQRLEALSAQGASHVAPGMFGGQPISFDQSMNALHGVTGEIDPKTAALEKFLGTMALAPVLPKNPVAAGALLGGADQALSPEPMTSLLGRAKDTALGTGVGAGVGWLLGSAIPQVVSVAKAARTPALGAQEKALEAVRSAANKIAYGTAGNEADAAAFVGPGTALAQKMADPAIKPFADLARSIPGNATASDGRIAMGAFKLMSREQGGLLKKMAEQGYDAKLDVQAQQISAAKQELMAEAQKVMPSFPAAVAQHAKMKGEEAAMQQSSDIAQSVFSGRHIKGNKLATKSVEAFAQDAAKMTPEELQQAAQGILGRLKENPKLAHVPMSRIPIPFPSAAMRRTPGLLDIVGQGTPSAGNYGPLSAYSLLGVLRGNQ